MRITSYMPGVLIVLIMAVVSYSISTIHPSFDSLVISIIMGMLCGGLLAGKEAFAPGVERSLNICLPAGIALYGNQLVFKGLNISFVLEIFVITICLFVLTFLLGEVFNLDRKLSVLLSSGLSICGASAIAVISPLIGAKKLDISVSIISVVMLGLTGMIFYPLLADYLMSRSEFIFLAGTTLPMLGQVRVAAGGFGPEALAAATEIKLIRISFLLLFSAAAVLLSGREGTKMKFPWFMALFFLFAFLANAVSLPAPLNASLKIAGSFLLSAALAAIGFSVDVNSVLERGLTPLGIIFISWSFTIMLIYIVRSIF